MKARSEYRRLSPLGRLAAWAAVAAILTFFVTLVAYLWPQPAPKPITVAAPVPDSDNLERSTAVTTNSSLSAGVNAISGAVRGNINTTIQTGTGDIFIGRQISEKPRPPYEEPTASEMQDAVLTEVRRRLLAENIQSVVFLALMKLDVNIEFVRFEKVDCGTAEPDPGYNCDYQYTLQGSLASGDNDPNTRKSVDQLNQVVKFLRSGPERGIEQGRFIKTADHWVVVIKPG
jgi:hypothetical protein